jgi:hypothetical protein
MNTILQRVTFQGDELEVAPSALLRPAKMPDVKRGRPRKTRAKATRGGSLSTIRFSGFPSMRGRSLLPTISTVYL